MRETKNLDLSGVERRSFQPSWSRSAPQTHEDSLNETHSTERLGSTGDQEGAESETGARLIAQLSSWALKTYKSDLARVDNIMESVDVLRERVAALENEQRETDNLRFVASEAAFSLQNAIGVDPESPSMNAGKMPRRDRSFAKPVLMLLGALGFALLVLAALLTIFAMEIARFM